jgi:hypothetical protein
MQWKDINFNPTHLVLRQFSALWIVFFLLLAGWNYGIHSRPTLAIVLAAVGLSLGTIGLIFPAVMRFVYGAWMTLAFPIGWTVSHIVLAFVYYGILTPFRFAFQIAGRDVLGLRRPTGDSCWLPKTTQQDVSRYLRQF